MRKNIARPRFRAASTGYGPAVRTRGLLRWAAIAAAVAAVAACSGSATSRLAGTSGETPSGTAAERQIAANWTAFFDASTPVTKRIALLQDGQEFASVIRAQAGSPLASQASASVTKVRVTKPDQAAVSYSILVDGKPALTGQSGTAVYQGGTWKVGAASFCGLLVLENGGSTKSLPAACQAAA
jgi:hypothetical protein